MSVVSDMGVRVVAGSGGTAPLAACPFLDAGGFGGAFLRAAAGRSALYRQPLGLATHSECILTAFLKRDLYTCRLSGVYCVLHRVSNRCAVSSTSSELTSTVSQLSSGCVASRTLRM